MGNMNMISMLPVNVVVPVTRLPEHTQRLIKLGAFNSRPVQPRYSIAIISNSKKRRRRRKRRGKRRKKEKFQGKNQNDLSSSTCPDKNAELVTGLGTDLSWDKDYPRESLVEYEKGKPIQPSPVI